MCLLLLYYLDLFYQLVLCSFCWSSIEGPFEHLEVYSQA